MSKDFSCKILEVKNLTHFYKTEWSFKKVLALNAISFTIDKGEAFGYLGHNGAGKTTTIKSILGLLKFHSGEIEFLGKSIKKFDHRHSLGYVAEHPYFYDYLTVGEIMSFYARLSGLENSRIEEAINLALKRVNFPKTSSIKMKALSKGLTQRIAIAQAIVNNPHLLILDEPFSGLDPVGRKEIRDLFIELKNQGTSILICSHILEDVQAICDRVAIISKGEIRKTLNLRDQKSFKDETFEICCFFNEDLANEIKPYCLSLTHEANNYQLRIVLRNRYDAEDVLAKILAKKIEIYSFNPQENKLESIFLETVGRNKDI
jgi:ABC-2 type transport system ATP-binding protein